MCANVHAPLTAEGTIMECGRKFAFAIFAFDGRDVFESDDALNFFESGLDAIDFQKSVLLHERHTLAADPLTNFFAPCGCADEIPDALIEDE